MSGRFMKRKKITIPVLTMIIMASQFLGCVAVNQDAMTAMAKESTVITISYNQLQDMEERQVYDLDKLEETGSLEDSEVNSGTENLGEGEAVTPPALEVEESATPAPTQAPVDAVTTQAIGAKPTATPTATPEVKKESISKKLTRAEKVKIANEFKRDIKLLDVYSHKGTYVHYINNMQGAKLTTTSKVSKSRMSVNTVGNKITIKVKKDGLVRLKLQYKGHTIPLETRVKLAENTAWDVNCRQVVLNKAGNTHKASLVGVTKRDKSRVRYKTSNRKVATVSKTGVITAKGKGSCKVTVKIGNRKVKIAVIVKSGATVGATVGTGTASVSLNSGASVKAETPKATPKPKATQASKNNKAAKTKAEEAAKAKAEAKKKAEAAKKKAEAAKKKAAAAKAKAAAKKTNNNTNKNTKSSSTTKKSSSSSSKSTSSFAAIASDGTLRSDKEEVSKMSEETKNVEIKTN